MIHVSYCFHVVMGELCEGAQKRADFHLGKKIVRSDHYRFLYSVRADCSDCVSFWLRNGADVERGTVNHPRWNAISWAEHFKADRQEIVLNYSLVEFRIFITCCLLCVFFYGSFFYLQLAARAAELLRGHQTMGRVEDGQVPLPPSSFFSASFNVFGGSANQTGSKLKLSNTMFEYRGDYDSSCVVFGLEMYFLV